MALLAVVLSGLIGACAALIALIGFDASFSQALIVYLVASVVPVAISMAGAYVHVLISRAWPAAETQSTRIQN